MSLLSRLFGPRGASAAPVLERVGGHRPFLKRDSQLCRYIGDGGFVLPEDNPGIRLEPDFVPDEALGEIVHATYTAYSEALAGGAGREQAPPWGHGDDLRVDELPPPVAKLAHLIAGCGAFDVGPLRDLTIEGRDRSLFHHEPRVWPTEGGVNVFVVSLLSSAVATFTPADDELAARGLERRTGVLEVGERSWSDADIDVLLQPRTLMHLSGRARDTWLHGIRPGVTVEPAAGAPSARREAAAPAVCDWWGAPDYLLQRGERRFAVVLSFGAGRGGGRRASTSRANRARGALAGATFF